MNVLTADGLTALCNKIKDKFFLKSNAVSLTTIGVDSTPVSGSTNLVNSGGVKAALNLKADSSSLHEYTTAEMNTLCDQILV